MLLNGVQGLGLRGFRGWAFGVFGFFGSSIEGFLQLRVEVLNPNSFGSYPGTTGKNGGA